jgi:hypothetical protein
MKPKIKSKRAYPKDTFGFVFNKAINSNIYINDELVINTKFPFIHTEYVTYVLFGEFWIEQ